MIAESCRIVADRVPVLAGITDTAFVESVAVAEYAAEAGVSTVVLAPPCYFPEGQPELLDYLHHIVPELPLPVLLYNMPMMTKISFAPETICQTMDIDGIVGIKDSSGDLEYFREICRLVGERGCGWSVLTGTEMLLPQSISIGGSGGVCGGANIFPRFFVDLYNAAADGDQARMDDLLPCLEALDRLYRVGHHASSIIKGIKCALSLLGICDDFMAEPFRRFRDPERQQVRSVLESLPGGLSETSLEAQS